MCRTMNIFIRADASVEIGTGHIMRCLTLSGYLREKRAKVSFICTETEGNLIEYIEKKGYIVYSVPETTDLNQTVEILIAQKVDVIIIDHYQIDIAWESKVRKAIDNIRIMVIDDLADRDHDCDLLLDQNYFQNFEKRYDGLTPERSRKLLGPNYLLLRPEFYQADETSSRIAEAKDILVFYGGSDPTNETEKALEALQLIDTSNLNIHVVVGKSNPYKDKIEKHCKENNYFYYIQIDYLAQLMKRCDLSLGAGGVTMWERCYLGLPSVVTIVADNQRDSTEAAANFGAIWSLGWHDCVEVANIVDILNRAFGHPEELMKMSIKAKQLMQSELRYETHPVVEAIMEVLSDDY